MSCSPYLPTPSDGGADAFQRPLPRPFQGLPTGVLSNPLIPPGGSEAPFEGHSSPSKLGIGEQSKNTSARGELASAASLAVRGSDTGEGNRGAGSR